MTRPPHIYVDLDDVLCETAQKLREIAEQEFGRKVVFKEIASFNIGISFDLDPEQVDFTMQRMHEPDMLLSVNPIPGAREILNQWADAGFSIEIVTGRHPSTREASCAWLEQHAIPYSNLVFVNKYNRPDPDDNRDFISLDELKEKEYLLAVDDSPEMLDFLVREMQMDVAIFDRPWNAGVATPEGKSDRRIERCHGWADLSAKFRLED